MFRLILVSSLLVLKPHQRLSSSIHFLMVALLEAALLLLKSTPHQVSLRYFGSHMCGGSIISPNKILTAAHCTDGESAPALSISYGSSDVSGPGGQTIGVAQIRQHPGYDLNTVDNDSSVLILRENIVLGTTAATVPSATELPSAGTNSWCTGWGYTSESGSLAPILQVVEMPIVTWQRCNEYYIDYGVTETMICAGLPEGGKDACIGDSGGPLVVGQGADRQLVGIESWGLGCGRPNFPGVYGSVVSMRDFITAQ